MCNDLIASYSCRLCMLKWLSIFRCGAYVIYTAKYILMAGYIHMLQLLVSFGHVFLVDRYIHPTELLC